MSHVLGYSLTVALRNSQRYVILGAPRYRHKGVVVVFHPSGIQTSLEKEDQQVRSNGTQNHCDEDSPAYGCIVYGLTERERERFNPD